MKIIECEQGGTAWFGARMGVVTASEVDALITPKWKARTGDGVQTYLCRKIAEKLLNYSPDQLNTFGMDQGKILETIAIPWFEFTQSRKVRRVGFVTTDDGRAGCSPDGLLDDGTGLEIKCPQAPNQIRYLLDGRVPDDYLPQVHFSMYVTGAPSWTFVAHHLHLPSLVLKVERDEAIQAAMHAALYDPTAGFIRRFDDALNAIQVLEA